MRSVRCPLWLLIVVDPPGFTAGEQDTAGAVTYLDQTIAGVYQQGFLWVIQLGRVFRAADADGGDDGIDLVVITVLLANSAGNRAHAALQEAEAAFLAAVSCAVIGVFIDPEAAVGLQ